jgi:hypothetical protein
MGTSNQGSAYEGLRGLVFRMDLQGTEDTGVQAVLMDWNLGKAVASVLAVIDGTASVYLSSGGGFIGGGQRSDAMRETAIRATQVATTLLPQMQRTDSSETPPHPEEVYLYARSKDGVYRATASVADVRTGSGPYAELANLMQHIITLYRQTTPAEDKPKS